MGYKINLISKDEAYNIIEWKYDEPYSVYDMCKVYEDREEVLSELLDGSYYSVSDDTGNIIGFFCFGDKAKVPIGEKYGFYKDNSCLDIGLGMKPKNTGKGLGLGLLKAGLSFAKEKFSTFRFRLTVATFNKRAVKVYKKAGFQNKGKFTTNDDIEFMVMVKEIR